MKFSANENLFGPDHKFFNAHDAEYSWAKNDSNSIKNPSCFRQLKVTISSYS